MNSVISFLIATLISIAGFFASIFMRVLIQAIRGAKYETDFVVPQELALLGLTLSFAAAIAYEEIPNVVCPMAHTSEMSFGSVFAVLFLLQFILVLLSVLVAGRVEKKAHLNQYEEKPKRRVVFWRLVYRNAPGFACILSVVVLPFLGR